MNDVKDDYNKINRLTDELKLKSHLFKAEAKERWNEVQELQNHYDAKLSQLKTASTESAREIKSALNLLSNKIEKGYENIKSTIQ